MISNGWAETLNVSKNLKTRHPDPPSHRPVCQPHRGEAPCCQDICNLVFWPGPYFCLIKLANFICDCSEAVPCESLVSREFSRFFPYFTSRSGSWGFLISLFISRREWKGKWIQLPLLLLLLLLLPFTIILRPVFKIFIFNKLKVEIKMVWIFSLCFWASRISRKFEKFWILENSQELSLLDLEAFL